jgi:Mlc titration factor MtfA (ptsG expression regulator)
MLDWFRRGREARVKAHLPAPEAFAAVLARFPALAGFSAPEQERLRQLTAGLLATKSFQGAAGFEPGPGDRLAVAVLAAAMALNRGLDGYRDFATFVLYPAAFLSEVEEVDEAGVVHRGRDLRAGEAWHRGPVLLAMDDVWQSGQRAGYNVVVHELAHQLDHAGGEEEGFPLLPRDVDPRDWTREFSEAYRRLNAELDQGDEPFMDPYATESPTEFFAVSCEYFFDAPEHLQAEVPGLYRVLSRYFAQDPAARLGGL